MVLKVLKERIEEMEDILKEKTKITPVWHKICPANAKRIGRDKAIQQPEEYVLDLHQKWSNRLYEIWAVWLCPTTKVINKHSNGFGGHSFRVQSARAAVRSSKPNRFQRIYNKIKARRGEKVAIIATARHMAESVHWVLTRKEYYKIGQ